MSNRNAIQLENTPNILSIDTTKRIAIESNSLFSVPQIGEFDIRTAQDYFVKIKNKCQRRNIDYVIVCCSDSDIEQNNDRILNACKMIFHNVSIHICAFRAPLFTFWVSKLNRKIELGEIIAITRVKTDGGCVCGLYTRGQEDGSEDFLAQYNRINAQSFNELYSIMERGNTNLKDVTFLIVYPPNQPIPKIEAKANLKIGCCFQHKDDDRTRGAIMIAKAILNQEGDHYVKIKEEPDPDLKPWKNPSSSIHRNDIIPGGSSISIRSNKPEISVGIDIGTTTCKAVVYYNNKAHIVKLDNPNDELPSYVTFFEKVTKNGTEAKEDGLKYPNNTVFDIAYFMGKSKDTIIENKYLEFQAESFRNFIKIKLGVAEILPEVACGELFKSIANKIDDCIKYELKLNDVKTTEVILTTPVFNERSDKVIYETSLKTAAKLAALNVRQLIDATTAAAVDYLYRKKEYNAEFNVCVIDIGGRNTNIAVYSIKTSSDALSLTSLTKFGNPNLGGRYIDIMLADLINKKMLEKEKVEPGDNYSLLTSTEKLKSKLSNDQIADYKHPNNGKTATIELREFSDIIQSFINKLEENLQTMNNNGLHIRIDKVLLNGKTCEIPKIQDAIKTFFPRVREFIKNKHICIARGAAIHAAKIKDSKDAFTYSY